MECLQIASSNSGIYFIIIYKVWILINVAFITQSATNDVWNLIEGATNIYIGVASFKVLLSLIFDLSLNSLPAPLVIIQISLALSPSLKINWSLPNESSLEPSNNLSIFGYVSVLNNSCYVSISIKDGICQGGFKSFKFLTFLSIFLFILKNSFSFN